MANSFVNNFEIPGWFVYVQIVSVVNMPAQVSIDLFDWNRLFTLADRQQYKN